MPGRPLTGPKVVTHAAMLAVEAPQGTEKEREASPACHGSWGPNLAARRLDGWVGIRPSNFVLERPAPLANDGPAMRSPTQSSGEKCRAWSYGLIVSFLVILFSRRLIPGIAYDWLNVIPLAAALYVVYCLGALRKTCGHLACVSRCLGADPAAPRPWGAFLFSPWLRSLLMLGLAVVALEFGLRCLSYHRSLVYERQGDLLFTPVPNQHYIEKISLTRSRINRYGLRGGPVDLRPGQKLILCLGDSITYGYGVDDAHTYPALLQAALERRHPGRYVVLNGGVNAYPLTFEHQKFLHLWNRGLRPDAVIVGYSMNEGWLAYLVDGDEPVKRQFARRVWLKNHLRSFALYSLVVENWARHYYDRMKGKLVPGTNFPALAGETTDHRYENYLQRISSELRRRQVKPVFLLFCGFNGQTGRYDSEGPFARQFGDFARTKWNSHASERGRPPAGRIHRRRPGQVLHRSLSHE